MFLTLSSTAQAQSISRTTADGLKYTATNFQINITGYNGPGGIVSIPQSINGLPVISIGSFAFYNCTSLSSIMIPDGVISIGNNTFYGCSSLISVTIPNNVISIGSSVFYNDSSLIYVSIPNGVTSIGSAAFEHCTSLTNVTIGNSVTSIGSSAFYDCNKLTSVTIPNSVTSIGSSAFQGCNKLISVTIGNSVTNIGTLAFLSCTKLKTASFMGNAPLMGSGVFDSTASGFTVDYYNGATGFASPWYGYPAVNIGVPPLASWLLFRGFPANANLTSTPNGDGVSLLMAYALNLDPTRNLSGCMPRPVVSADQMKLTFYAGSAGVTYFVESSTDLQKWSTVTTVSPPDANNFRTATVPMSTSRLFMRLGVSY